MSDFEKNNELSQKYGKVMDSIADDIRQINLDKRDPVSIDEIAAQPEAAEQPVYDPVYNTESLDLNGDANEAALDESITCDECRDMLYDYVSDATDMEETRLINIHLNGCENCRLELDDIKDMLGVLSLSEAETPEIPSDLVSGISDELAAIAPEVKADYAASHKRWLTNVNIKELAAMLRERTDKLIRNANWRIVAPAALSAVLVVGVAGSGIYQVMKTSDELYDFSDNSAIASAGATARPSESGLDDYVGKSSSSAKATAKPSSTSSPKSTSTPSSGSSSGLTLGTGSTSGSTKSSGSSSSSSSSKSSSGSSSNSNSSSSSSSSKTASSSSSSKTSTTPSSSSSSSNNTTSPVTSVPTPAPTAYVTPNIILPEISTGMTLPTEPEAQPTELPVDTVSDAAAAGDGARISDGSSGDENGLISEDTAVMTASLDGATPSPTSGGAATSTPSATPEDALVIEWNADGETAAYAELTKTAAESMDNASIVGCIIENDEIFEAVMSSEFAECSMLIFPETETDEALPTSTPDIESETKADTETEFEAAELDPTNAESVILYMTGDKYIEFLSLMQENELSYHLVTLGTNDDVKVVITRIDTEANIDSNIDSETSAE